MLVFGFIISTGHFFIGLFQETTEKAVLLYRQSLGRVVIIGLEMFVAATIVKTITLERSFEAMEVLVLMVMIRVFLGFTTELEITGRWPWQKADRDAHS